MAAIEIYSTSSCPYCIRAKQLLDSKGIPFVEINLDGKEDEIKALKERTGWRTVPQIFIKGELIGGFDELNALNRSGKLEEMLK